MRTPDGVAVILRLQQLGWGTKRIADDVGCTSDAVKRYLAYGVCTPGAGRAWPKALDALADWVAKRFCPHRGNADVVLQDLLRASAASRFHCAPSSARSRLCGRPSPPRRKQRCASRRRPADVA